MNPKTHSSRGYCLSAIAENKTPRCSIQEIRGKLEDPETIGLKGYLIGISPVGAPKSCERERYYLSCDGIDETMSERGGENHA